MMKKLLLSLVLVSLVLLPAACSKNPTVEDQAKGNNAEATPVFKDDFEKGKPEGWEAESAPVKDTAEDTTGQELAPTDG